MEEVMGRKQRPWAWVLLLWVILVASVGLYAFIAFLLYN